MKKYLKALLVGLIFCVFTTNSYSEGGVESLSPELRSLLSKEMGAIQEGMKGIIPAYAAGDLSEVAEIAGKIKNSFILKQQVTKEQKHELHHKLPAAFIQKDQKFHQYAGMLQHVSQEGNMELVGFYYSRLIESCVGCHTEHARHRFPELSGEARTEKHHH